MQQIEVNEMMEINEMEVNEEKEIVEAEERTRRPFIRKSWISEVEKRISEILMEHPHPGIATVYAVCGSKIGYDTYVDIEMVNVYHSPCKDKEKMRIAMQSVQEHLHKHGIMYIDWNIDHIGIGADGNVKLFDFNACGIATPDLTGWSVAPIYLRAYNRALDAGISDPVAVDNYCFQTCFLGVRKN